LTDKPANELTGLKPVPILTRSESSTEAAQDLIAREEAVALVYNGISHAVMMASPLDLDDFARGFSLTEGIIENQTEILDILINRSELGIELSIQLLASSFNKLKLKRRQIAGRSGCGLCGIDSLKALRTNINAVSCTEAPGYQTIAQAVSQMQTQQRLQQACGAVHCAALVNASGNITLIREDIGRHNALDKLIGGLKNPLAHGDFILMSSRASYELVMKAASINCGTLVCLSAPTSYALEQSQLANMNLIGFVRENRHIIYNKSRPI